MSILAERETRSSTVRRRENLRKPPTPKFPHKVKRSKQVEKTTNRLATRIACLAFIGALGGGGVGAALGGAAIAATKEEKATPLVKIRVAALGGALGGVASVLLEKTVLSVVEEGAVALELVALLVLQAGFVGALGGALGVGVEQLVINYRNRR